jgi:uncharacterized protein
VTVFVDSSALVKLYVNEPFDHVVRSIVRPMVIAALARVEVPAAFWRKHRLGEITDLDAAVLSADFAADVAGVDLPIPRFAAIVAGEEVLTGATDAVARHPLRAYDAVQLASALVAARVFDGLEGFVAFDRQLRAAAAAEGLSLVPPTLD